MSDTTPTVPNLTPIVVKTKLEKALVSIESGIQTLTDKEAALVYNTDHLQEIADFIALVKKGLKKAEEERVTLKAPSLREGESVDTGASLVKGELNKLLKKASDKYTEMAKKANQLQKEADDEKTRVKGIKDAIDNTIMSFSTKIAEAKDLDTLLDLERRLNLETANEKRYAEQLTDLKSRTEAIRSLLSLQKQNVKQLGGLEKEAANALEMGEDGKLEELEGKKEELSGKIGELKTRIQETAINQSTAYAPLENATQIFPTVKAKRRQWKFEVTDLEKLAKKFPELVIISPNEDKIREILKAKIADGETKGVEEIGYHDVIKFFVDKKYV